MLVNRHLSHSLVVHSLFEWDVQVEQGTAGRTSPCALLEYNVSEFAPQSSDLPFMRRLIVDVVDRQRDVDQLINRATPKEWPLERVARVDRCILRMAGYEILFGYRSGVLAKEAHAEAVLLAKRFGRPSSSRFIDGVLHAVRSTRFCFFIPGSTSPCLH